MYIKYTIFFLYLISRVLYYIMLCMKAEAPEQMPSLA